MACGAQRIYVCKSHKQNGDPIGQLTTGYWATKLAGSQMEILITLDKNKRFKNSPILYFEIEQLSANGKYEIVLNSDDYEVGPDTYWAVWQNPGINISGHYRVSTMISGGNVTGVVKLAVTYFYFDAESPEWNPTKKDILPYTDYKDVIIEIGKSIDTIEGFIPLSELNIITKLTDQKAVRAAFVIRSGKIIRTNALHVKLYLEDLYFEPIDSMQFYAMPLRDWAGFYYHFSMAGLYRMEIYNDENVLIKTYDFAIKEF
jgi:hypothetical protein